jgi:two-component system, OmpR family, response regulator
MRVLVVEDEVDLQSAIVRALREAGYAVDAASDGNDASHKAIAWEYDAIVLDLMLPEKDGWTVLADLRKSKKTTPVLILTARDAVSDRVKGLDSGADDYLLKPFAVSELLARLRALIRRTTGIAIPTIAIRNVTVDTASRTVTKDGQPVSLTASEYALVELLAIHHGQLVTRTMIYDHLFDENESSLSNLVDVHVSNIRKKLGNEFIETRRGQGYIVHA